MISVLVALVQFGFLAAVSAEAGRWRCAAVVIVTMFAAMAFDPRLMWDAVEGDELMTDVPQARVQERSLPAHLAASDCRRRHRVVAGRAYPR